MTRINDDEVNKTSEWNLLHDIINPPKRTKKLNSHYFPILHVCINTRKGRSDFKYFRILSDIGCSSTIVIGRLVKKIHPENILWCSGTRRLVILLLILRLNWISTYPHLARQMLWRGNVMWMPPLRVGIIWS